MDSQCIKLRCKPRPAEVGKSVASGNLMMERELSDLYAGRVALTKASLKGWNFVTLHVQAAFLLAQTMALEPLARF